MIVLLSLCILLTINDSPASILQASSCIYIKLAWGGPEKQAAEITAGNIDAKDWQDKAKQIVENTVSPAALFCNIALSTNRWHNTTHLVHLSQLLGQKTPVLKLSNH